MHIAGLWKEVQYNIDEQDGGNYRLAFEEARSILSAGKLMRPGVAQSVWVVSDAEYSSDSFGETALWAGYIKSDGKLIPLMCIT